MNEKRVKSTKIMFYGSLSGLVTCIAGQPFDLVRTRLQETPSTMRKPKIMPIVRSIYRQDGIIGFWRGTVPSVWRLVPGAAIFFTSVNQFAYLLKVGYHRNLITSPLLIDKPNNRITPLGNGLIGASARTTAAFLLMPMTVVKTRFESLAYRKEYETMMGALGGIWRAEGIRGLWRGWGATIMRDAPYSGIVFAIFERLKPVFGTDMKGKFGASFVSGLTATFLTTPFDAARTRVQLKPGSYPNWYAALGRIGREEGVSGFYRGTLPRMVKKTMGSALGWFIFDELMARHKSKEE